ncbi:MAG: caspase domain-containing protein, partial [Alphaproteobacteria bacterium]
MLLTRSIWLAVLSGLLALTAPALAEQRVALVIGNSAYKHAPALANPKNDAEGMAASLRRLKFEVVEGTDLDKPAMERLLQAFADKLEKADVALVFYAGHGLQVNGRNYLVPVDGKLDKESDLVFQAVPLDVIQGLMEQGQRTNIMILDACRDNPLARNLARTMGTRSTSIGRGLGETKAGIGTLIVYATQPGNVALDGDTKNSPFTAALLKHIEAPGLEIRQVLTRVRNDVITATREKQVPWDSSSLRGDFFFAAASGVPETKPPVEAKPGETKPPATTDTPPRGPDQETV